MSQTNLSGRFILSSPTRTAAFLHTGDDKAAWLLKPKQTHLATLTTRYSPAPPICFPSPSPVFPHLIPVHRSCFLSFTPSRALQSGHSMYVRFSNSPVSQGLGYSNIKNKETGHWPQVFKSQNGFGQSQDSDVGTCYHSIRAFVCRNACVSLRPHMIW